MSSITWTLVHNNICSHILTGQIVSSYDGNRMLRVLFSTHMYRKQNMEAVKMHKLKQDISDIIHIGDSLKMISNPGFLHRISQIHQLSE